MLRLPRPAHIGLSPRVRGNLLLPGLQALDGRSIPACTGEPAAGPSMPGSARVYPRVYGGTGTTWQPPRSKGGLSPRVRGNHQKLVVLVAAQGSIPACTGEPCPGPCLPTPPRVYPRVYGGTGRSGRRERIGRGLSPRVRGNQTISPSRGKPKRSIPACTGEPWNFLHHSSQEQVYPRVYGGTEK